MLKLRWDLILEYLVGAATVAVGWSAYFVSFLHNGFNARIDTNWTQAPVVWDDEAKDLVSTGAYFNLPAVVITLAMTTLLIFGIQESVTVNNLIVGIKITVGRTCCAWLAFVVNSFIYIYI